MHLIVIKIIPFCLFIHSIFNIWAYGNSEVFPLKSVKVVNEATGESTYEIETMSVSNRLTSYLGAPFVILMIVFIVLILIEYCLRIFFKAIKKLLKKKKSEIVD